MGLVGKGGGGWVGTPSMAWTSGTPSERAASTTCAKISSQRARVSKVSLIRAANLNGAEARWAGSMAGAHHLLGLSLAAVRRAPECPMLRTGDCRAGGPELPCDAAVACITET